MKRDDAADTTFVCPECGADIPVTRRKLDALLEQGCVFCGASVSDDSAAVA